MTRKEENAERVRQMGVFFASRKRRISVEGMGTPLGSGMTIAKMTLLFWFADCLSCERTAFPVSELDYVYADDDGVFQWPHVHPGDDESFRKLFDGVLSFDSGVARSLPGIEFSRRKFTDAEMDILDGVAALYGDCTVEQLVSYAGRKNGIWRLALDGGFKEWRDHRIRLEECVDATFPGKDAKERWELRKEAYGTSRLFDRLEAESA